MSRRLGRHLLVFLAMTVLAVVQTWPLVPLRATHLLGGVHGDPWINAWQLDLWRHAVIDRVSPYFVPTVHWPIGGEYYWHTQTPTKSLLGVLLPWFGYANLANQIIFWTFPLAGLTAWWLVRDVLRRGGRVGTLADLAAFAGATVFAFSRYHMCQAHAHTNLASIEGLPLFVFFALRYLEDRKLRWLLGLAPTALYVAGCDFYYLYYCALFLVFWVIAEAWRAGPLLSRATLARLVPAIHVGIVAVVASLPPVLPLLLHLKPTPFSDHGDSSYMADPLMWIVPDTLSRWQAILPSGMEHAFQKLQNGILNDEEGGLFFGIAAPVIAALAIRRAPVRPWLDVGLVFLVLSLGNYLHLGGIDTLPAQIVPAAIGLGLLASRRVRASVRGREVVYALLGIAAITAVTGMRGDDGVVLIRLPMPFLFFKFVAPLFSRGGMAVRFGVMSGLAFAVMVGIGAYEIARRRGVWALAAVILVLNVELANKPFQMSPLPPYPAVFDQIRDDPEDVAVFTDHVIGMYEQLYLRRPISFAKQSRNPLRELALVRTPLYRRLMSFDFSGDDDVATMRAYLVEHRFRYFVGHRRAAREQIRWFKLDKDSEAKRSRFLAELGGTTIFADDTYEIVQFW